MLRSFISSLFAFKSGEKLSISLCIGLAIGLLPFYGFRGVIVAVSVLLLRLNVLAVVLGFGISLIAPVVFTLLTKFGEVISSSDVIYAISKVMFTDTLLSAQYYSKNELSLFIIINIIVSLISIGIFYSIIETFINRVSEKRKKISQSTDDLAKNKKDPNGPKYLLKLSLAASMGFFCGAFPVSRYSLILLFVLTLIFRFNILSSIFGYLSGILVNSILVKYVVFIIGSCEDKYEVAKVLTGQLSLNDIFSMEFTEQRLVNCAIIMLILIVLSSYNWARLLFGFANNNMTQQGSYVFHDVSGTRWIMVKRLSTAFLIVIIAVIVLFGLSSRSYAQSLNKMDDFALKLTDLKDEENPGLNHSNPAYGHKTEVYAFYVSWDEKSKKSFDKNADKISVLITDWMYFDKNYSLQFKADSGIDKAARKKGVMVVPSLNNYINEKWDSHYVNSLLKDINSQKELISKVTEFLYKNGYDGLNLDFEYFDQGLAHEYTRFLSRFKQSLSQKGLKFIVDVQINNKGFEYAKISNIVDKMVMMLYDEHTDATRPGPVSGFEWFKSNLDMQGIEKEKIIAGIGMYGYDWKLDSDKDGTSLTFNQVMKIANEKDATFLWDSQNKSPVLKYKDGNDEHIIFFNDTAVFYNHFKAAAEAGIHSLGLWRLGSEDASMWDLLGTLQAKTIDTNSFVRPKLADDYEFDGDGEIIEGYIPLVQGIRVFKFDKAGWIQKENYKSFPVQSRVKSAGKNDLQNIALTFDDGPDPMYTPFILDILKKYNVKATFFVVGSSAEKYPELLSRIYNEGHEIGNHTYNHIDTAMESTEKITREINMTNRIIENATGHSTTLFRPPYDSGVDLADEKSLNTFININTLGYKMVGNYIDSLDWEEREVDAIVENIESRLYEGNVVLMHDGGGDRNATVNALPQIIDTIRDNGLDFVTVGQMIGLDYKQVMPPADAFKLSLGKISAFVNIFLKVLPEVLTKFFYLATTIGLIRFVFLIVFATKQRRNYLRKKFDSNSGFSPKVSIVVAAYNEEKVICKTVNSLLQSDYENLEVIVVNDGSKDNTSTVVEEAYKDCENVRLINKANGGKSSAVNRGFMDASGEIVVVLDADTIISKDAISLLVRHFIDENVAAVSGNVKVGNVSNIWTTWQHVEYVTGLNLERRAFDALNCITVVPGAIGAWRKELVAKAGYYKEDTLAEDADITLTFLRQGYKIVYEEGAKAFTEAPVDLKSLLKQRVRWSYGTLQCLWKHRDALFNKNQKALGFIALPNTWLYQVVFQSLSPLTDILFFLGLIGGQKIETVITYIAFFMIDLLITCYAFHLEGEKKRPLLTLFIQRIVYRQLMTYVVYKSILSALMGVKVGWNKLKRLGNVVQ